MTPLIAKIEAVLAETKSPEEAKLLRQVLDRLKDRDKARQYCPRCHSELVGFDSEKSKEGYYMPCWRCRLEQLPILPPPPPPSK